MFDDIFFCPFIGPCFDESCIASITCNGVNVIDSELASKLISNCLNITFISLTGLISENEFTLIGIFKELMLSNVFGWFVAASGN